MSEFINTANSLFARESAMEKQISRHQEGDILRELFLAELNNVRGEMRQLWESDIEGGEPVRFTHNSYAAAIVAVNDTVERGWLSEKQGGEQIDRLIEEAKSDDESWRNIKIAKRLLNISGVSMETDSTDSAESSSLSATEKPYDINPTEDTETINQRTEVNIEFDYDSGFIFIGDRRILLNRAHATEKEITLQRASLLESISKWNNEVEPGTKISPKDWWELTFEGQVYDRTTVSNLYNWMERNLTFRRQKIIGHTGLRGRGSKYVSGNFLINIDFENKPILSGAETDKIHENEQSDTRCKHSTESRNETREPQASLLKTGLIPDIEKMAERRIKIKAEKTRSGETARTLLEPHRGYSGNNSWRLASGLPPAPIPAATALNPESHTFEEYSNDDGDISEKEWEMIDIGELLINDVFSELAVYFRTGADAERIKTDRLYHLKPYSSQSLGRAREKSWISREVLGINLREAMRLALVFDNRMLNLYGVKRNKKLLEDLIGWKVEEFIEQKQQQASYN